MKQLRLELLVLIIVLLTGSATAQDYYGLERVEELYPCWTGMGPNGDIEDERVYLLNGTSVSILDISNPETPRDIGRINPGIRYIYHFDAQNTLLYLIDKTTLYIVNAENPQDAEILGAYQSHDLSRIVVAGDYAFLASDSTGILILNIHDPANIETVASVDLEMTFNTLQLIRWNEMLLVGGSEFAIIDVSDEQNPEILCQMDYPTFHFAADNDFAYLLTTQSAIRILDLTNCHRPFEVGHYNVNAANRFLGKYENFLYISYYVIEREVFEEHYFPFAVTSVIDVSDPYIPEEVGHFESECDRIHMILLKDGYLIMSTSSDVLGSWFDIFTFENPPWPHSIGRFEPPLRTQSIENSDSLLYSISGPVNEYEFGLFITDISNIHEPEIISHYPLDEDDDYYMLEHIDDRLYAQERNHDELRVFDVSNPREPIFEEARFHLPTYYIQEFAQSDDNLFIACPNGMVILPKDFRFWDSSEFFSLDADVRGVKVRGEFAYLPARSEGILIVDISDPFHPQEIRQYETQWNSYSLDFYEDYLLVANGNLSVYELTNPATLELVRSIDIRDSAFGVDVVGEHAFVRIRSDGRELLVFDLTDPTNPVETGYCRLNTYNFKVGTDYLYALENTQIGVYDFSEAMQSPELSQAGDVPSRFSLYPAYPNPFNSTATVRFITPCSGRIKTGLYSLTGRKILDLSPGSFASPGINTMLINPPNLAAGSYMLTIEIGEQSESMKLIYVK